MVQCSITSKCATALNINSSEKSLVNEEAPLKLEESLSVRKVKEVYRILAIALCFISLVVNFVLCILSLFFASKRQSPATFAFAADCLLDLLSSLIVIWRYFGSPYRLYSASKENTACISLGVLFIIAGIGVITEGTYFLIIQEQPKWFAVLVILAAVGVAACVLLGMSKFILAKKMKSKPLFLDALNSLLSAAFALVIIISDVVYAENKEIWYLDPVLSIILCLGLIAYGIYTIVVHCKAGGNNNNEN